MLWEDLSTKAKIIIMQGTRRLKLPTVRHNEISSTEKQKSTLIWTLDLKWLKKYKVNFTGDNKARCTPPCVLCSIALMHLNENKLFLLPLVTSPDPRSVKQIFTHPSQLGLKLTILFITIFLEIIVHLLFMWTLGCSIAHCMSVSAVEISLKYRLNFFNKWRIKPAVLNITFHGY